MFGVNSDKKPTPILVKKVLLVLPAYGMLGYSLLRVVVDGVTTHGEIYSHLDFVLKVDVTPTSTLKLNEDFYWNRIKRKSR